MTGLVDLLGGWVRTAGLGPTLCLAFRVAPPLGILFNYKGTRMSQKSRVEQSVVAQPDSFIWLVELGHQSKETVERLGTWSSKARRIVKESA